MIIKNIDLSELMEMPKVKKVFSRSGVWHAIQERNLESEFENALNDLYEYSGEGIDFLEFLSDIEYNWSAQYISEMLGIWDDENEKPLNNYSYDQETESFIKEN
jgi:hypothetical protein